MPEWEGEIRKRLAGLKIEPTREAEIVEEMAQHLDDRFEELSAAGATEEEARRGALGELCGNEVLSSELSKVERAVTSEPVVFGAAVLGNGRRNIMRDLWQDIRFGLRMLRKNMVFTSVAVLSLALGIGANTAIFTLINAVLLKSLPVAEPERLVLFTDSNSEGTMLGDPPTGEWQLFSHALYERFRDHNESFQGLCAFRSGENWLSVRMEGIPPGDAAAQAMGHLVSGNYFEVLGVKATMGRVLASEDDAPGARAVAVISHKYWKERCGGDPQILDKAVVLNGTPFTIVGVTPPEFFGERVRRAPDFWLPLVFQPQIDLRDSYLPNQQVYWLNLMGRLKPGVSIQQAQANVNVTLQQFLIEQAGSQISDERLSAIQASHVELKDGAGGISGLRLYYSEPLRMLMAIVVMILMIACANVGNLLLARSASRQMEISMRLALGASRARLVRQLLTESVLLAAIGGALGLLSAQWGVSALVAMVSQTAPLDITPDTAVLAFTVGVSLAAGILFGLLPALRASKIDLATALKEKATRSGGGRLRFGLAPMLVVSQVALSLVLLVGAGLFARSLMKLEQERIGFNKENVLLLSINSRMTGYKSPELTALYRDLLDRVGSLPGARSATLASYSPLSGISRTSNITVQGYTPEPGEDMNISQMLIGPSYCETLGLPLLAGREIGPQDTPASPRVAVVNETFARHFFPEENPIGRRFGIGDGQQQSGDIEIVGVIGDAKYESVWGKPVRMIYRPILQVQEQSPLLRSLEVRTEGDPLALASQVRAVISDVNDKLAVMDVTSFSEQIASSLQQERLIARLVSFFGLLALVLACIGLYGVMAHAVVRRTNEIGIRMALGADPRKILWMVLRETLVLVFAGIAIGVPVALAAARLISSQLFEVNYADPLTIIIATAVLIAVAALAGYLPARRAAHVDPMVALRFE
ncbi:MAG TPA: ABC transporter permease [Blastocatellia bacterium]|nr:ABC transporter permease [Blastocatellia bacterium]